MRFGGRGRQPSPAAMEKQRPVPLPACSSTSVGFFASQRNGSPWGSTRKKYARPDPAVRKKMRTAKMTAHRRFSSWLREWQNQTTRCIAYLTHPVCAGITVTFSRGISPHSAADPPKEPAHRSYINYQVEYITPSFKLQEVRSDIVNYLTKKYSGGRSRPILHVLTPSPPRSPPQRKNGGIAFGFSGKSRGSSAAQSRSPPHNKPAARCTTASAAAFSPYITPPRQSNRRRTSPRRARTPATPPTDCTRYNPARSRRQTAPAPAVPRCADGGWFSVQTAGRQAGDSSRAAISSSK